MQPLAKSSQSPGAALFFLNIFHCMFSSNGYPDSWGEDMLEVVAGDPKRTEGTEWVVNFFQLPNIGEI